MITGTGIDIIEIDRIEKAIDRWGSGFLNHVFNEEEITYAQQRKFPAQHFAARFAAKEAIYKAFGSHKTLQWKDMSILNDKDGKPYCQMKDPRYQNKILISVSHTKTYAVASAIITQ